MPCIKLSVKYKNEREDICNKLLDITGNEFLLYELDNNQDKQQAIMALKDEVAKYFAEHTKDQKNIYPRKTIHEKSRRIIYNFSYKMGVLNEKRCKKFECVCGKQYTQHQNMYRHRKTCEDYNKKDNTTIVLNVLEQNKLLQQQNQQLQEQNQKILQDQVNQLQEQVNVSCPFRPPAG